MKKNTFTLVFLFFSIILFSQNDNINLKEIFTQIDQKIDSKQYKKAEKLILEAHTIATSDDELLELDYYTSKLYSSKNNDEKSLELLLKGFTKLQATGNSKLYIKYGKAIGQIFGRVKNYDRALKYHKLVLQSAKKRNDSLEISSANFNLGSAFQMKKELDSAIYYYDEVIKFHPKDTYKNDLLATTYNNLMSFAVRDYDFNLAELYGKKSLAIHTKLKDTLKMAGVLSNLGGISMYKNELEKSKKYSFEAVNILKRINTAKAKEILFSSYDNISQVYYMQKNYNKAYDYLFEATEIRHKAISDKLNSRVTEIEAKYNVASEATKTKEEENKRQRAEFWLYILMFSLIMLTVFSWVLYRNLTFKRKNLELIHAKEKLLDEQKIVHIKNDAQLKILSATLDAKEAERKYIAEILHDSVSTLLSSANMHLYAAKCKLTQQNIPIEILKTESIVNEAADKIRNLSHKLISPVLLKFGLETSIEGLCDKCSNSKLLFDCNFKGVTRYNQKFEVKIHNIIEELINNILKHSNATEAAIIAEEKEGVLMVKISDDGSGFDKEVINKKEGLGLSQIEARIKMLKGNLTITSSKEKGTRILMSIPINDKKSN